MSHQTLRVLHAFANDREKRLAGSEISRQTRLLSGTLYPILIRLEQAGWLSSKWEALEPSALGRPRKRLYRLTVAGQRKANEALAELR